MSTLLHRSPNSAEADIEDMAGPRELIRNLIRQGHRRIALVTGPLASRSALARMEGCLAELENQNIPVCSNHVLMVGPTRPSPAFGRLVMAMESRVRPTAVVAFNNRLAREVSLILDELGHRVPEDVTVACLSNVAHELAATD